MSLPRIVKVCLVLAVLVLAPSVRLLAATCTVTVEKSDSIQSTIDSAGVGSVVCIKAGEYQVNILMKANVVLQGEQPGQTVLIGADGDLPVLTAANTVTVQNLMIRNQIASGIGILAANGTTGVTVRNVVVSNSQTGLACGGSSNVTVENTVFDANPTAIDCPTATNLHLRNSIITGSTAQDVGVDTPSTTFNNNLLFANGPNSNYPTTDSTTIRDKNPEFVDPANLDFHLKANSPALDAGTGADLDGSQADIGAYGGANADPAPFKVAGLTVKSQGANRVNLGWQANNAHNIKGYKVHFDTDEPTGLYQGTAAEGSSPVLVTGQAQTTFELTGLSLPDAALTAPTGLTTVPGDGSLLVSWQKVDKATGYRVFVGLAPGQYSTNEDVKNATEGTITGLVNNQLVYVTVAAYFAPTLFVAVSAVDNLDRQSTTGTALEISMTDNITEGPRAAEVVDFAEPNSIFPDVKDEYHCFVATAAFGSSLAPQVAVLRQFRNLYLLPHGLGRWLVSVYYRWSPGAATLLDEHGWLKGPARVALYPAIGVAWLWVETGPGARIFTGLLALAAMAAFLLRRFK